MKKSIVLKISIFILVAVLTCGLIFACDDGEVPSGTPSGTETPSDTPTTLGKTEILANLSSSLTSAIEAEQSAIDDGGTVSVDSSYELIMGQYKYRILYAANYDYSVSGGARSEFYLKIYDSETALTRIMLYYKDGDLYAETTDGRVVVEDVGQSGIFSALYSFVSYFDMSSLILDEDVAELIVELNSYIDGKKIKQYAVSDNRDNISLTDVNFDTRKELVNEQLKDSFEKFSTTYDAISKEYLGIELSRLATLQLTTLNANLVEFYSSDKVFDRTDFDFSGILESKESYSLKGSIAVKPYRQTITLETFDNPATLDEEIASYAAKNNISVDKLREEKSFSSVDLSRRSFDGELSLDFFGTVYDARLFFDLDLKDDSRSEISFKLLEEGETVSAVYYRDSRLYFDMGDFFDTLGSALSLGEFNLPRVFHSSFNLSDSLNAFYDTLDMLVRSLGDDSGDEIFKLLNKKLVSEDTTMTLYIDRQFVEMINDMQSEPLDRANVATFLAGILGIDDETIATYLSAEAFDLLRLVVTYDFHSAELSLRLETVASESDAYAIVSVDEDKSLYDEEGTIDESTSSLTIGKDKYYFYQYTGELFSTSQRVTSVGSFKGDSESIIITLGSITKEYFLSYEKYGVTAIYVTAMQDGKKVEVKKGKIYTAQGYILIDETEFSQEPANASGDGYVKYYLTYEKSDGILYKDKERTEIFEQIDFSKYLFKHDDVYYYVGGSALTIVLKKFGTIDVFSGKIVQSGVEYYYRNGIVLRNNETAGVLNAQGTFVIKSADGTTSYSFLRGEWQESQNRTPLYLQGDEEKKTLGYYYHDYEAVEFVSGDLEDNVYALGEGNVLLRIYGTIDLKDKEITIGSLEYKVNFGGVYTTTEGIDPVMELVMRPASEVRTLYRPVGAMTELGSSGSEITFTLSGSTYYVREGDKSVYTDESFVSALPSASYDYGKRTVYLETSAYRLLNGKVYYMQGEYAVDDSTVTIGGIIYYVRGEVLYRDYERTVVAGSVDEEKIVLEGAEEYYHDDIRLETSRGDYKELTYAENAGFVIEGTASLSQVNSIDVSRFLGAFIGDSYGVNTPYTLKIGEKLRFVIKTSYYNDVFSFYAAIYHDNLSTEKLLVEMASAYDDGGLLINYNVLSTPISFRSTPTLVLESLKAFAGEGTVFSDDNVVAAIYKTIGYSKTSFSEDGMNFSVSYDTSTGYDPVKALIGLEYLSMRGALRVVYDMPIPEAESINAASSSYNVPAFTVPDEVIGDNIYQVNWIETLTVGLGEDTFEIIVPYRKDSIKIESGKTLYCPTASIFGQEISYNVILKDKNGTKGIFGITDNEIVIDPWAETPIPDKLEVTFTDGTRGYLDYEIEGFSADSVTGYGNAEWDALLKRAVYPTYTIVIGRGSIGETVLEDVTVKVVTRLISSAYDYQGSVKVVTSASIDPYDYESYTGVGEETIKSASNPSMDDDNAAERFYISFENGVPVLRSKITLSFYDYYTVENHSVSYSEILYVLWDYDFSRVSFSGSETIAVALEIRDSDGNLYYVPDGEEIAAKISSERKVFKELYLYDIVNDVAETRGYYTVDSLDSSTYDIPSRSTSEYMVLLYFDDGSFRVIGDSTVYESYVNRNLIDVATSDGIFDDTLDWEYKSADYFTEYGTSSPLGGGTASVNRASIGGQTVTLTVREPARRVITETKSVNGYVKVDVNGNSVDRTNATFTYNRVQWDDTDGFYEVNPYENGALPSTVTVSFNTSTSGEQTVEEVTYPIMGWVTDTGIIMSEVKDGKTVYRLAYPTTEESYFKAELYLGDGNVSVKVTVVIHNLAAEYESYSFYTHYNNKITSMSVDAFSPYRLPEQVEIVLKSGETLYYSFATDYRWFVNYGTDKEAEILPYSADFVKTPGKYITWSDEELTAFSFFVKRGEGTLDRRLFGDNYYMPSNSDGEVTLTAYISGSEAGSIEQKLEFKLKVVRMSSFDISRSVFSSQSADGLTIYADTYSDGSGSFYERIAGEDKSVLIDFYSEATKKIYSYYQPISFLSGYSELIDALTAPYAPSTSVTTSFVLDMDDVEVEKNFVTTDKVGGSYYFKSLPSDDKSLLDVAYDRYESGEKRATITVYKIYALSKEREYALSKEREYALPYDYFSIALSSVLAIMPDGSQTVYSTDFDTVIEDKDAFNRALFTFENGSDAVLTFSLKQGKGSAQDYITVNIIVKESSVEGSGGTNKNIGVDIYNSKDGSINCVNGYDLPKVYSVTYNAINASGETISYSVDYTGLVWKVRLAVSGLTQGAKVDTVPVNIITDNGLTLLLESSLPDGTVCMLTVNFYPKRMSSDSYRAEEDGKIRVENGIASFETFYELNSYMTTKDGYRIISPSVLPDSIYYSGTDTSAYYEMSPIAYKVTWSLTGNDGYFFCLSNDGVIKAAEGCVKVVDRRSYYKVAVGTLARYNESDNGTVELYVTFEENNKTVTDITADGYNFSQTADGYVLNVDPYEITVIDGKDYYLWEKNLPTSMTATLLDGTTYEFNEGEFFYTYGGERIERLVYDYEKFLISSGSATEMNISVVSSSEREILTFKAVLENKIYSSVKLPYQSVGGEIKYLDNVYYIDPYNSATHSVPTTVDVLTGDGDIGTLSVVWTVYSDSAHTIETDLTVAYTGAKYYLRASLPAYRYDGDRLVEVDKESNQYMSIVVVVIDRRAKGDYDYMRLERTFSTDDGMDYISARLSDIVGVIGDDYFVDRPTDLPDDYRLSYPSVVWNATDDDIVNGMDGSTYIQGYLGATGQEVRAYVVTDKLTLKGFDTSTLKPQYLNSSGVPVIFLNPYTLTSVENSFAFIFEREVFNGESFVAADNVTLKFYVNPSDDEESRRIITYAESMRGGLSGSTGGELTLGNATKTAVLNSKEHKIFFSYQNLTPDYVRMDLGLGDTDNVNGSAYFVIDPLQPYLTSSTDKAKGFFRVGDALDSEETYIAQGFSVVNGTYGLWMSLGEVRLDWDYDNNGTEDALENMPYNGNDGKARSVTCTVISDVVDMRLAVRVGMYYLDRTPSAVLTDQRENRAYGVSSGAYSGYNALDTAAGITINPLNNYSEGSYHLMSRIVYKFINNYDPSDPQQTLLYKAFSYYGDTVTIEGLDINSYYIPSPGITLAGTDSAIEMSLVGGRVQTVGGEYTLTLAEGLYTFSLNVTPSEIVSTSITESFEKGSHDLIVKKGVAGERSEYAIDPYNLSLPDSFSVVLGDVRKQLSYTSHYSELWGFDDDVDKKLADLETITNGGKIKAYITICGEKYYFTFEIMERKISVTDDGNTGIVETSDGRKYIDGGIVYVRKTSSFDSAYAQLPDYLYYDFSYPTGDFTRVPLTWDVSDLSAITREGEYAARARMGAGTENNIIFTVKVVDVSVYEIMTRKDPLGNVTDYDDYDFVYDKMIVSLIGGERIKDGDDILTPSVIRLDGQNYFEVKDVVYDLEGGYADFILEYEFGSNNENTSLAGDAEGNKIFSVKITVPIVVNNIDNLRNATTSVDEIRLPVGEDILLSEMPVALDGNGNTYYVFWDVTGSLGGDEVDVNRAGEYSIRGRLLTFYRELVICELTLIIEATDISESAEISRDKLNYSYSGEIKGEEFFKSGLTFIGGNKFFNTDGDEYEPDFRIEFFNDGVWSDNEPVNAGDYRVRVSAPDGDGDINVIGSREFSLKIRTKLIETSGITFVDTETDYNGRPQQPRVLYDGEELKDVRYSFTFSSDNVASAKTAVDAGRYIARLVFEQNDNYDFSNVEQTTKETVFIINKRIVEYRIVDSEVYDGTYRHATVEGLPDGYEDMGVEAVFTYTYSDASGKTITTNNPIKNVGTYSVSVTIKGGLNYNDAVINIGDYKITPKKLVVRISDIISIYPEVLPLEPVVEYDGIAGEDVRQSVEKLLGALRVTSDADAYEIPSPGVYKIKAEGLHNENYDVEYVTGDYIVKLDSDVEVLDGDLNEAINTFTSSDGRSIGLYLDRGDYGDLIIDAKGRAVKLIGEYDADGTHGTTFRSITLINGSLELIAIGFLGATDTVSLTIKSTADSVIASGVGFYGATKTSETTEARSAAISAETGYTGSLSIKNSFIERRTSGIIAYSAAVDISDTRLSYVMQGIAVRGGSLTMTDCILDHCMEYALYVADIGASLNLVNNEFIENALAILYNGRRDLTGEAGITGGNKYLNNTLNFKAQN